MAGDRRHFDRVQFGRGYAAKIVAIDGTWQRDCRLGDVSDMGARLTIRGSVEGLDCREFFLMLSTTGGAHRRCERVWLSGDELGVRFLKETPEPARRGVWKQDEEPASAPAEEA